MTFPLVPYFAAIAEAEKTGESVDFHNVTSEMIAEHMPACNTDLDRHLKGLDWQPPSIETPPTAPLGDEMDVPL
jgi:hypothetical protein